MIVWLASYPRSGNTFLRVILNKIFNIQTYSIYDDKKDIGGDAQTSDIVGHQFLPEGFDISNARSEDKLYFIKTHELPNECVEEGDKVIYLIRDGRESVLSYLRYTQSYGGIERTLEDTIYGNILFSGWGGHVKAWFPNERENTLLIKFEELIDNPESYIQIISNFLEIEPVDSEIPLFSELNEINPKFFRAGKKGSWKEVYSEDEMMAFWFKNYTQMIEYGYVEDIPEIFNTQSSFLLFKQLSAENSYLLKELLQFKDKYRVLNKLEKQVDNLVLLIERSDREITENEQKVTEYEQKIQEQSNELSAIKNSKSYRLLAKLSKLRLF